MAEIVKITVSYVQLFYFKIQALFSRIKIKSAAAKIPNYSRRDWIFKAITLYICAIGMDLSGLKINELTILGKTDFSISYYYLVHGLCMALALWKLFEMYWFARAKVKELNLV